ncbi:LOW QUALITY PROTEIN: sodium-dependent lysophosphatidylcholine symporter 1-B-like [Xiphophorus hellerii]|uniref:LOW QUALITY PROTEIN: sodium-dependent lysophosphatidylcholine symporter 1-B-like n=1 Tax=Xiphophorus hellerii TaxID=8084 RepID=UPI0013B3EC73|nr:LOW QUALITY PROTEIN: sodium-dependent lysophosphatidylcholine symporter 1-like [Xiphophorus hellerii]
MSCSENFTKKLEALGNILSKRGGEQRGSGRIPLMRKICYAIGGVPHQITSAAIGISLQIFLLDVVQMKASSVSLILFLSRVWDAVTDPLVGYLVTRSTWTPIGKLKPWLVVSTPFGILSYVLLWLVPADSMSEAACMLWFLTAACLFETLMSCYNVPYVSLSMSLGGHQRDRDSATAYRMSVEMTALLLVSVIQGKVVSVFNVEKQEACEHLDQVHQTPHSSSAPQTASLHETQKAFLTSAGVTGGLFLLSSLVLFSGVREQRHGSVQHDADERTRPSYLISLKMLMCHAPYQRLVLGFVFSVLAFQMSLGNFALFCSHAAGLGAHFQLLLLVLLISASVAVPLWQFVLLKIGKKSTVFIGLSLFVPAVITVACVPSSLPVFLTMCVLMGFSVATVFLLPWSMLPDVIDDFALRHPSCKDLEPLFFSGYAFCSKLAGGLSVGLSTMILQVVGYKAGACNHGDEVVTALVVLFSPAPVTLLLIGMGIFHTYPVNERNGSELKQQNNKASSSPANQRELSEPELPTNSQQSRPDDPKPDRFYNCDPSPGWSSTSSTVAGSLHGKNSRNISQVNPQWRKPMSLPDWCSEGSESFPGNDGGQSHVRSQVSWV